MALTVTAAINAQAIGTGSNIGNDKFAAKVTLQAGTIFAAVEAMVTNGTLLVKQDERARIRVYFALCSASLTATDAPNYLRQHAKCIELIPSPNAAGVQYKLAEPFRAPAGYLYVWADVPTMSVAAALTVNAIEMPA